MMPHEVDFGAAVPERRLDAADDFDTPPSQDPRDRYDDDTRDASAAGSVSIGDWRDLDRDRDREIDGERGLDRDRETGPPDPRDVFLHDVDLPRGDERETVFDRDRC